MTVFRMASLAVALGLFGGAACEQNEAGDRTRSDEESAASSSSLRSGPVDVEEEYDLDNLQIPLEEIHSLLPRDRIPALTDPKLVSPADADWLEPDARVIAVEIGGEAVAFPLPILNFHEVANLTLGGRPIAVTYCPLCDSATVVSREIERPASDGGTRTQVLEFGVSGALYNSNVLMYDRTTMGLWSQLGMRSVSGPLAGTSLEHLPVRIVTWETFQQEHPGARVLSRDTGHDRSYDRDPYAGFFEDPDRMVVPVPGMGDALPKKTLGVGILAGGEAWFVAADAIGEGRTVETPLGPVELRRSEAGIEVASAPEDASTAQTFYYAWSAFNPATKVIAE